MRPMSTCPKNTEVYFEHPYKLGSYHKGKLKRNKVWVATDFCEIQLPWQPTSWAYEKDLKVQSS